MKLYLAAASPACKKILAVLSLLDIKDVEMMHVDPREGTKSDDYLKLNANGKVPTLVDDDFAIWESNAIMQYLAEKFAGHSLFPTDRRVRTNITRWQFWEANHYNQAVYRILWETMFKRAFGIDEDPNEERLASGTQDFHRYAKVLETELASTAYLVGDALTLADLSVGLYTPFLAKEGSGVPVEDYPQLQRWYAKLLPHFS
ncbi:MAG: glutathione S-transferase family protein [Myxococcota bacterium]